MTRSHSDPGNHASADSLEWLAQGIARRRMAAPALLFLVSHRPLSFVASQLLYAVQPLAELFDWGQCEALAAVLSTPDVALRLETALAHSDERSGIHASNRE